MNSNQFVGEIVILCISRPDKKEVNIGKLIILNTIKKAFGLRVK